MSSIDKHPFLNDDSKILNKRITNIYERKKGTTTEGKTKLPKDIIIPNLGKINTKYVDHIIEKWKINGTWKMKDKWYSEIIIFCRIWLSSDKVRLLLLKLTYVVEIRKWRKVIYKNYSFKYNKTLKIRDCWLKSILTKLSI